jgi:hypothetical protein
MTGIEIFSPFYFVIKERHGIVMSLQQCPPPISFEPTDVSSQGLLSHDTV